MGYSVNVWGTCKGITTCCTYIWNAHSFWPSYEDQSCDPDATWCGTPVKYGSTTSFVLSDFQVGNEVVMTIFCLHVDGPLSISGDVRIRYVDSEGTVTNTWYYYFSFSVPSGYWEESYAWAAIGVRPKPWPEIWNNSYGYRVEAKGTSGGWTGIDITQYYAINYLDTTNVNSSHTPGYMWVEGERIAFVGNIGAKIFIGHDGTSSFVGTDKIGHMWIEDDRLGYIDANGYKRKTKRGDKYWINGWEGSAVYAGASAVGHIWVMGSASPYWTKIGFVGEDGYVYRMGPGYVHGDQQ